MVSGHLYYYDPCGFRATLTLWSLLWFLGNYVIMSLVVSGQLCYYDPCGFMATILLWSLWFQGNYIIMILVVSGQLYYYDPCGFMATLLLWSLLWFHGNFFYYDPCCGFRATFSLVLTMGYWPARRPWRWWTWASPTLATSWWSRRACTDTRPISLWGATAVRPARRCPRCTTLPSARPTPCSNPWRPASPRACRWAPWPPWRTTTRTIPTWPCRPLPTATRPTPRATTRCTPPCTALLTPAPSSTRTRTSRRTTRPTCTRTRTTTAATPTPTTTTTPSTPTPTTTPCRTRTATRASWRCSRSASSSGGSSWASRRPTWARPWPTWRSPAWAACPSPPSAASSRWRSATTTWSPSSPSSWPGWTRPRGRLESGRRRPERTGRRRGRGRPLRPRRSVVWKPTSPCSLARLGRRSRRSPRSWTWRRTLWGCGSATNGRSRRGWSSPPPEWVTTDQRSGRVQGDVRSWTVSVIRCTYVYIYTYVHYYTYSLIHPCKSANLTMTTKVCSRYWFFTFFFSTLTLKG